MDFADGAEGCFFPQLLSAYGSPVAELTLGVGELFGGEYRDCR